MDNIDWRIVLAIAIRIIAISYMVVILYLQWKHKNWYAARTSHSGACLILFAICSFIVTIVCSEYRSELLTRIVSYICFFLIPFQIRWIWDIRWITVTITSICVWVWLEFFYLPFLWRLIYS
ncbi:hypothetical protein Pla110_13580 [Polystyrenella longa]|uniref:Uncharacterized protein n=1 Tax=Polystyrenella longa TaxID=2528007 RepID=A0A518CKA2_9PLAN|nr:hypothetical protein Pla110_13580 [Polystyrenella longa]